MKNVYIVIVKAVSNYTRNNTINLAGVFTEEEKANDFRNKLVNNGVNINSTSIITFPLNNDSLSIENIYTDMNGYLDEGACDIFKFKYMGLL